MNWWVVLVPTGILAICCAVLAHQWYAARAQLLDNQKRTQDAVGSTAVLRQQLQQAQSEVQSKAEQLEDLREDLERHRGELEKRPELDRKEYRIVTLGIGATGKTALTLKWANPLVHLKNLVGTKFEKYERTVSLTYVKESQKAIQHVFEVNDWGGEHIDDAQAQLVKEESIHGMLFVVDLGKEGSSGVDEERVRSQLREFESNALRFLFSPAITRHCKTVVLFINKSDLIRGTPAEVEEQAKRYYKPLIDDLNKLQETGKMELLVLVGSASYGHNVHHLFAHFVQNILPRNAYDDQLLQRLKVESDTIPPPVPHAPNGNGRTAAAALRLRA